MSNEEREKIEIIKENIKKMIQFPNDETMKAFNIVEDNLQNLNDFLKDSYEKSRYLENAKSRLEETLKTFSETIFWLEKNRESVGKEKEKYNEY